MTDWRAKSHLRGKQVARLVEALGRIVEAWDTDDGPNEAIEAARALLEEAKRR